jgi:hypothetical protein
LQRAKISRLRGAAWALRGEGNRVTVLSRVEENEIMAAIQSAKLGPLDFEWATRAGTETMDHDREYRRIVHKPTAAQLEFSFMPQGDGHWLTWLPMFQSGERSKWAKNWTQARDTIVTWVRVVKGNHEAPDLWRALKAQGAIPDAAARADQSSPFSAADLKLLDAALDDIEAFVVTTQPLDPDGRTQVSRRFAYLREAARSGARKIDWLNIFVGQVVGMVTTGLLQPSFYGPLMSHAATAFNAVFNFGVKLLQQAGG